MTNKELIEAEVEKFEKKVGYINDHYPNGLQEFNKALTDFHKATIDRLIAKMPEEEDVYHTPTDDGYGSWLEGKEDYRKEMLDILNAELK